MPHHSSRSFIVTNFAYALLYKLFLRIYIIFIQKALIAKGISSTVASLTILLAVFKTLKSFTASNNYRFSRTLSYRCHDVFVSSFVLFGLP